MGLVSPDGPVYQAGTLSGNPLAMTAGIWCLDRLKPRLYRELAASGRGSRPAWPTRRARRGVALQVNAFGSLLTPFFTDRPVRDFTRPPAPTPTPTRNSSEECSRAASIRRRRNSKPGSCRRRTP